MKALLPCTVALVLTFGAFTTHAQTTVSLSVTDASMAETIPGAPANSGNVRVTRTGSIAAALTVWVKLGGTALRGVDYSFGVGVIDFVTIPAGSAIVDISIRPLDDQLTEGTESVRIELDDETQSGANVPYSMGTDRVSVNLLDNEDPSLPQRAIVGVIAIGSQALESLSNSVTFRISRTANLAPALEVRYTLDGTAEAGSDYAAPSALVVLPPNVAFADVNIVALNDTLVEGPESVIFTLMPHPNVDDSPPPVDSYLLSATTSATVTIYSDDLPPPPTVNIRSPISGDSQSAPGTIHIDFSAVDPVGHITHFVLTDGVTVVASNSVTHPVPPVNGTPFEFSTTLTSVRAGLHSFRAKVWSSSGLSSMSAAVQAVVTNIPPIYSKMSVTAVDAEAAEGLVDGQFNPARFVISVDAPMPTAQYVVYRISSPGPGTDFFSPTHYSATNWPMYWMAGPTDYGYAYFPTGVTSVEIVANPVDDAINEGTETLTLTLSYPFVFTERTFEGIVQFTEGGFHTPPFDPFALPVRYFDYDLTTNDTATAVILDNDMEPTPFAIVAITATDAEAEETAASLGAPNVGVFTVSRVGPTNLPLQVHYQFTSRPRDIPLRFPIPVQAIHGVDFERILNVGVATIPAGAASTEIVITPINDLVSEIPEYVQVHLRPSPVPIPDPSSYLLYTNSMASLVIRDLVLSSFTPIVRIKTTDAQAVEQNSASPHAVFRVERLGSLAESITIPYSITGTAINGVDYVALPGFVTLAVGVSSAPITIIPYLDGETNEPDETVILTLKPPQPGLAKPPYVLGSSGIMVTSAGATIREDALVVPPHRLNRFERALRLRFPSRYRVVIVPLPILPVSEPAPAPGAPPKIWAVEASTDLVVWEEIGETEDPEDFADVTQGDFPQRFYRFRELPQTTP